MSDTDAKKLKTTSSKSNTKSNPNPNSKPSLTPPLNTKTPKPSPSHTDLETPSLPLSPPQPSRISLISSSKQNQSSVSKNSQSRVKDEKTTEKFSLKETSSPPEKEAEVESKGVVKAKSLLSKKKMSEKIGKAVSFFDKSKGNNKKVSTANEESAPSDFERKGTSASGAGRNKSLAVGRRRSGTIDFPDGSRFRFGQSVNAEGGVELSTAEYVSLDGINDLNDLNDLDDYENLDFDLIDKGIEPALSKKSNGGKFGTLNLKGKKFEAGSIQNVMQNTKKLLLKRKKAKGAYVLKHRKLQAEYEKKLVAEHKKFLKSFKPLATDKDEDEWKKLDNMWLIMPIKHWDNLGTKNYYDKTVNIWQQIRKSEDMTGSKTSTLPPPPQAQAPSAPKNDANPDNKTKLVDKKEKEVLLAPGDATSWTLNMFANEDRAGKQVKKKKERTRNRLATNVLNIAGLDDTRENRNKCIDLLKNNGDDVSTAVTSLLDGQVNADRYARISNEEEKINRKVVLRVVSVDKDNETMKVVMILDRNGRPCVGGLKKEDLTVKEEYNGEDKVLTEKDTKKSAANEKKNNEVISTPEATNETQEKENVTISTDAEADEAAEENDAENENEVIEGENNESADGTVSASGDRDISALFSDINNIINELTIAEDNADANGGSGETIADNKTEETSNNSAPNVELTETASAAKDEPNKEAAEAASPPVAAATTSASTETETVESESEDEDGDLIPGFRTTEDANQKAIEYTLDIAEILSLPEVTVVEEDMKPYYKDLFNEQIAHITYQRLGGFVSNSSSNNRRNGRNREMWDNAGDFQLVDVGVRLGLEPLIPLQEYTQEWRNGLLFNVKHLVDGPVRFVGFNETGFGFFEDKPISIYCQQIKQLKKPTAAEKKEGTETDAQAEGNAEATETEEIVGVNILHMTLFDTNEEVSFDTLYLKDTEDLGSRKDGKVFGKDAVGNRLAYRIVGKQGRVEAVLYPFQGRVKRATVIQYDCSKLAQGQWVSIQIPMADNSAGLRLAKIAKVPLGMVLGSSGELKEGKSTYEKTPFLEMLRQGVRLFADVPGLVDIEIYCEGGVLLDQPRKEAWPIECLVEATPEQLTELEELQDAKIEIYNNMKTETTSVLDLAMHFLKNRQSQRRDQQQWVKDAEQMIAKLNMVKESIEKHKTQTNEAEVKAIIADIDEKAKAVQNGIDAIKRAEALLRRSVKRTQ